jgi:spore coat protein U-like protein
MSIKSTAVGAARLAATIALTATAVSAAADDFGTLNVSANVPFTCRIDSVAALAFGNVSFADNTDNSADITWRCTRDSVTTIELGAGASRDPANQYMQGPGGSRLPYQLSTQKDYSDTWGDGSAGTTTASVTGKGMGASQAQTNTIYGRVDPTTFPEDLAAGAHSDSLTVTIKF